MRIKLILLFLLSSTIGLCQEFVTVDNDIYELVENVNYSLYKRDSLVYSNVTLSDKPTKISREIDYDSIVFSRVDYETLGLAKRKIDKIILLTKKTFTLDEIVISSEKKDEIILGEKNRFVRSGPFNKEDEITYGIIFRNESKQEMLIDKVAFYVDKVKHKTTYKIAFHEVEEIELAPNLFAEIGKIVATTDTLYLFPKQKNRIEVPLDIDVLLSPDKPLFVSFQLIGHYDEFNNPITPELSQKTKLKFQISNKFDYYSKLSDIHTGELSVDIININRWLHYDYYYTFFKKPHKSALLAPAVLLHLKEVETPQKLPIKNDFKNKL
jgi:hypothetical protein